MPHLLGEPYENLFEEAEFSYSKAALPVMEEWELKNYTLRVEETEHGDMLFLGLTSLPREQGPVYGGPSPGGYAYDGVVTLEQAAGYPVAAPPYEKTLKLHPRYSQRSITRKTGSAVRVEGVPPNVNVTTTEFPLPPSAWQEVTLFDVPVKVISKPDASLKINMHLSSTDTRRITQGYAMVQSYSESFEITLEPGNEWAYVEAEAKTATDLRGFGD
jgi:hypothetical protein